MRLKENVHSTLRFAPFALTLLFLAWCLHSLHGDLAQVSLEPLLRSWDIVGAAALLSLLNYALRIHRWRGYLSRLGHTLSFGFTAPTYIAGFAYTVSPGKVGEMMRARYYLPKGVPLADVTAAFFAERLLDVISMLFLASLLLTALGRFAGFLAVVVVGVVAVLAAVALLPWQTIKTRLAAASWIASRPRQILGGLATAFASTKPLLGPGLLASGFLTGLLAWGLEGAGLGLLTSIYPLQDLSILTAVGIYGIAVLVGGLSFLPGGLGGTEVIMTGLLASRGYPLGQALMLTLVCRLVTLWLAVCIGWIAVFWLRHRSRAAVESPWR
jgi:uncharacterized protein (TIRG00374 family)